MEVVRAGSCLILSSPGQSSDSVTELQLYIYTVTNKQYAGYRYSVLQSKVLNAELMAVYYECTFKGEFMS